MQDVFSEFAILLFVSSLIGMLAVRLKQPLIVGFIAVGILLGPSVTGLVTANDQIDLLAKLGISLLLFIVGLKLDLNIIRTMGPVALATGVGQVLFTSVFGYLIAWALGFSAIESLYIAVALTFSSTIIIVKLLSDKREVDALHGRIAVGFLIVQDILVIVAMIALNALNETERSNTLTSQALYIALYALIFVAVIALLMRYVLSGLLDVMARSKELLVLFSIAWAVTLGALGSYLGFSKEVGAFLAGVSLASTPYREVIAARLSSLRDFLLLFFFVDLGASLNLAAMSDQVFSAIVFSLFVIVGNPLIVMVIMGLMGYRKRTGFLAGLTVAQISEFSLILAALGISLGHLDQTVLGLITLVGLITISASTYMILYSHHLYRVLQPFLNVFEREYAFRENLAETTHIIERYDCLIFGLGRFGRTISISLKERGFNILGVDFDPDMIHRMSDLGIDARYGDAEDTEFIEGLNLASIKWIVVATHDKHVNQAISQSLKKAGYQGQLALTAHSAMNAESCFYRGDELLIIPHEYAAERAAEYISQQSVLNNNERSSALNG